jgi:hypothetical protein
MGWVGSKFYDLTNFLGAAILPADLSVNGKLTMMRITTATLVRDSHAAQMLGELIMVRDDYFRLDNFSLLNIVTIIDDVCVL